MCFEICDSYKVIIDSVQVVYFVMCGIVRDSSIVGVLVKYVIRIRYPMLKIRIYYSYCHYSECSHFLIINYDRQISIVMRMEDEVRNNGRDGEMMENNDSCK